MKVKYSRSRHNAKQTSFTSPMGARRQCGEQEHAQYYTNHDVRFGWSCRRPENVSILSSLMPVSTATPERSFSTMRRVKTYLRSTMKTERLAALCPDVCLQRHIHWCRSRDLRILRQKEQTSSFRDFFESTKISDTLQLMCRLAGHYVVAVVDHNHNWLHFLKYSIISCSIWNPSICQLI